MKRQEVKKSKSQNTAQRLLVGAILFFAGSLHAQTTTQPGGIVDEALVKKLLGGETTSLGQVEAVLTGTEAASKKLGTDKDAGQQTQKIQKGVIENLDQLIAQARKNSSKSGQKSSVSRRQKSPRRGQPKPGKEKSAQDGGAKQVPMGQNTPDAPKEKKGGKEKAELARGWGYLPGRDREEVLQGFDEEFLARYREQIMQYYRDLAKAAEEQATETSATDDKPRDTEKTP